MAREKPIETRFFTAGHCVQREGFAISSGGRRKIHFPALFVLIKHHALGNVLFDTGYSERFFSATARLPYSLYAKLTPVSFNPDQSAARQLEAAGIPPQSVDTVIISHFHADHIGGLRDFPKARIICARGGYDAVRGRSGLSALLRGFLPQLMPEDFDARVTYVEAFQKCETPPVPFTCYDVSGDGSLIAVELPGHAAGQLGLVVDNEYYLVSDACWLKNSHEGNLHPHNAVQLLTDNWSDYLSTLGKLHRLSGNSSLKIVPSHCETTIAGLLEKGHRDV
jgi:glyoxylase-like metal-dependent hydrolase (beta-lactamase superfamily II)